MEGSAKIESILWNHVGKDNAIHSDKLIKESGSTHDSQDLRKIINFLRCNGSPICSDRIGYYMAKNETEIMETIDKLHSRANQINRAANGLEDALYDFRKGDDTDE